MASSVISSPNVVTSGLKCVEWEFQLPDLGVDPEINIFIYRLKNVTDNEYLTKWKEYIPVENGQTKIIDFSADLFGILSMEQPPLAVGGVITNQTIIKTIEVEFGTRVINTETCAPAVDTLDGITDQVDVLNGVPRFDQSIGLTGTVLTTKKKTRYSVSPGSYEWLYVIGTMGVRIKHYSADGTLLSTVSHSIIETHPGSQCTIIPIGFQVAPSGTEFIQILAKTSGTPTYPADWIMTIDRNFGAVDEGSMVDVYFQTNMGAMELLSFQSVDNMAMNSAKQEIINRFECGSITNPSGGQRNSVNNQSFPTFTLKRQFQYGLPLNDSFWLGELAASGNVWTVITSNNGTKYLVKIQLVDQQTTFYSESDEFAITGYFSEVLLYPY